MRALFSAMLGLGASIWAGFPAVAQRAEPARVGLLSVWNRKMLRGPERALFARACKLSATAKVRT